MFADCWLHANCWSGNWEGRGRHVQATLWNISLCKKCFPRTQKSQWAGKQICALSGLYRSWVPDENLGMSVGELVCWDLEVGHQHLHSFPVESQKGHVCLRTWHFNWSQITKAKVFKDKLEKNAAWMNLTGHWAMAQQHDSGGDRADRICSFPSTRGETCQVWAAVNTGER